MFSESSIYLKHGTELGPRVGGEIEGQGGDDGTWILLPVRQALQETAGWCGPFTMNTHRQLYQAERKFRDGTFLPSE